LAVSTPGAGAEIGSIQIPDGVTLHVRGGSTLRAAVDPDAYATSQYNCLIESHGTSGIGITGQGVIDGRGRDFMEADLRYIYQPKEWRPRLIGFYGATDVRVRDVTLRNSPSWTLHPAGCRRVNIEGITIDNDLKIPNCDGIDPDRCHDVRISNCVISSADDCIVIKNTRDFPQYGDTRRITVTGCTLVSTSAAVKVGTESVTDFADIEVTGCVISDSSRGIALQLRDQGNIERVIASNCTISTRLFEEHYWGRAEPISITALPRFSVDGEDRPEWNRDNRVGTIRDVTIHNIRARGENGLVVYGISRADGSSTVENIRLTNVDLTVERLTRWPAGRRDLRPCDALGGAFRDPSQDPGLEALPHNAISIEGTSRVSLSDVSINWRVDGLEGYGTPIHVKNNAGLVLDRLTVGDLP